MPDMPWFPRTRGDSLYPMEEIRTGLDRGSPAHAGIVRSSIGAVHCETSLGFPRTRGDSPWIVAYY